uniref:Uncharacterized protein n=1 Tax=Ananas comosus var. bracteatus TaxID=296719 RepID=A0A6V7NP03_ANACO|nr:unnamed protein product [Ananas comosus var. bracteatus]
MSSSNAGVVDVRGDPPKQPSKRSKSKDSRITRESAFLEDRLVLLEDIISKMAEWYTEMADSFNSFNDDVRSMEESVATAMATFQSKLEKLQGNMTRCDKERKNLIEELVTRVDEVEDLKTRVAILEKADLSVGSPACAVPNGPVVVNIPTLGMSLPHGIPFRRPIPHEQAYVMMAISGVPAYRERPAQACANEHNGKQAKDLSQIPSPHV